MTNLERLIHAHVEHATVPSVTTVATTTETIAESLAREILSDPAWRRQMRELIETHFDVTRVGPSTRRRATDRRRTDRRGQRGFQKELKPE